VECYGFSRGQNDVARFTIIYRDSRSLIRSRPQDILVSLIHESCREDVIKDLKAGLAEMVARRKSRAVFIAFGTPG
jgi:hypothetical protein